MRKKDYYLLTLWFFLLNLIDALMTIHLVIDLKVAKEINPIMDYLLQLDPWGIFFSTKMLVGGMFCYGIHKFHEKSPTWSKWAVIGSVILYNLVLLKHSYIVLRMIANI